MNDDTIGCGWALILCLILVAAVTASGVYVTHSTWQKALVNTGYAEYYLDGNNERQWRMKEPAK